MIEIVPQCSCLEQYKTLHLKPPVLVQAAERLVRGCGIRGVCHVVGCKVRRYDNSAQGGEFLFLLVQAVNGLSDEVGPGQTIMLPCGRVLTYVTAYNAGLLTRTAAVKAAAG